MGCLGSLTLCDARTGAEVRDLHADHPFWGGVSPVAFSPDGRSVAARCEKVLGEPGSSYLAVFETCTGRCRWSGPLGNREVTALTFLPDGKTLVSGHDDTSILLWDYRAPPPEASANRPIRSPESCWEALREPDARAAFLAQKNLAASGEAAAALLRKRLRPAPVLGRDAALTRLAQQLDDDRFEVRRNALTILQAEGPVAQAVLMQALRTEPSPEARSRIRKLLEPLWQRNPTPDQLQAIRGVEALEWIGTPAARRVVEELARGRPGDRLTREAEAALARMKR